MAEPLDLDRLERQAAVATDPDAFSLHRQYARACLRDDCTPEVIKHLIWEIRALELVVAELRQEREVADG